MCAHSTVLWTILELEDWWVEYLMPFREHVTLGLDLIFEK
jgi:hypothetical protein